MVDIAVPSAYTGGRRRVILASVVLAEGSSFVSHGVIVGELTGGDVVDGNVWLLGDYLHYSPFGIAHSRQETQSSSINYNGLLDSRPVEVEDKGTGPPVETNVRGSIAPGMLAAGGPVSLTVPRLATVLAPDGLTGVSMALHPSVGLGVAPRVRPGTDPLGGETGALGN